MPPPTSETSSADTHRLQLDRLRAETDALRNELKSASAPRRPASPAPLQLHDSELAKLQAEAAALRQQLKQVQRLATVGTMAAMVAHEFNNILTSIINYAQLAQRNPAMTDKALARAVDGGQRATHICKAILGITRQDDHRFGDVYLATIISDTLTAVGRDPKRDNIDVEIQTPADLTICTLRVELQQVLLNLVLNARAAVLGRPGLRRIEISAEVEGRFVLIRVRDNGVGIPTENLSKIFDPFFTTSTPSDSDPGGNGLGLHICREIVTAMGGQISADSTEGQGSTFTVRLPAAPPTPLEARPTGTD